MNGVALKAKDCFTTEAWGLDANKKYHFVKSALCQDSGVLIEKAGQCNKNNTDRTSILYPFTFILSPFSLPTALQITKM